MKPNYVISHDQVFCGHCGFLQCWKPQEAMVDDCKHHAHDCCGKESTPTQPSIKPGE